LVTKGDPVKTCPLLDNPCNHQNFCCYDEANRSKQMRFDEKYQLLDLKEDAEAKFFVAREISSGRQVSVFLFVGEQAGAQAQLMEQLRTMDRSLFPELIETGKNQATPYIVTQPISSFAELKARALRPKTSTPVKSGHKQNDFAKAGVWHVLQEKRESSDKPSAPATTPSKPDLAETIIASPRAPGGSIQMFQTPAALPTEDSAPGQFTRISESPASAPAQQQPGLNAPATPPPAIPGDYARRFSAQSAPAVEEPAVAAKPHSKLPLILGGILVLLVIAIAVLLIGMRN
jgi:hypothetical protein